VTVARDLKSNGSEISVTDDTKDEYIGLIIERKFVSRIQPQVR
jgi:hypothetical protein